MNNGVKIGILTFHDTTNFGATLQAVALYKVISEMGGSVEIINYHCAEIDQRELPKYQYEASSNKMMWIMKYILRGYKNVKKHRELVDFLKKEAVLSNKYYSRDNIYLTNRIYDHFVIGSDMLWNTDFTLSDYTYMLDFVEKEKGKYAFATSGTFSVQDKKIAYYLDRFNGIAVRETGLVDKVSFLLNKTIYHVCDPTMLIKPKVWKTYLKRTLRKKPYCLMYFDDHEGNVHRVTARYSKENNVQAFCIGFSIAGMKHNKMDILEIYSVNDFLTVIANAEMLFTASYHGMLFAIYFHVPFVYFNKDPDRLNSIAEKLGLEARNGNKYDINEMREIDWGKVDEKREQFSNYSIEILKSMLAI